jgi:hypothetical protein
VKAAKVRDASATFAVVIVKSFVTVVVGVAVT